jgi:hypothetical protein
MSILREASSTGKGVPSGRLLNAVLLYAQAKGYFLTFYDGNEMMLVEDHTALSTIKATPSNFKP